MILIVVILVQYLKKENKIKSPYLGFAFEDENCYRCGYGCCGYGYR